MSQSRREWLFNNGTICLVVRPINRQRVAGDMQQAKRACVSAPNVPVATDDCEKQERAWCGELDGQRCSHGSEGGIAAAHDGAMRKVLPQQQRGRRHHGVPARGMDSRAKKTSRWPCHEAAAIAAAALAKCMQRVPSIDSGR